MLHGCDLLSSVGRSFWALELALASREKINRLEFSFNLKKSFAARTHELGKSNSPRDVIYWWSLCSTHFFLWVKKNSWINFHNPKKASWKSENIYFIRYFFYFLRPAKIVDYQSKESENRCRTPDGRPGKCDDLSNCPGLLLDLTHLRESLCFKSLFVPGVCCPTSDNLSAASTTQRPLILTTRPTTTRPSLFLNPISTTSQRPLVPVFTISSTVTQKPSSLVSNRPLETLGNYVDSDECGQQEYSSGRIVGGVEAPTGQWPWLAAIFLHGPKRTEFWCGGSLIGSKYVNFYSVASIHSDYNFNFIAGFDCRPLHSRLETTTLRGATVYSSTGRHWFVLGPWTVSACNV